MEWFSAKVSPPRNVRFAPNRFKPRRGSAGIAASFWNGERIVAQFQQIVPLPNLTPRSGSVYSRRVWRVESSTPALPLLIFLEESGRGSAPRFWRI